MNNHEEEGAYPLPCQNGIWLSYSFRKGNFRHGFEYILCSRG